MALRTTCIHLLIIAMLLTSCSCACVLWHLCLCGCVRRGDCCNMGLLLTELEVRRAATGACMLQHARCTSCIPYCIACHVTSHMSYLMSSYLTQHRPHVTPAPRRWGPSHTIIPGACKQYTAAPAHPPHPQHAAWHAWQRRHTAGADPGRGCSSGRSVGCGLDGVPQKQQQYRQ